MGNPTPEYSLIKLDDDDDDDAYIDGRNVYLFNIEPRANIHEDGSRVGQFPGDVERGCQWDEDVCSYVVDRFLA